MSEFEWDNEIVIHFDGNLDDEDWGDLLGSLRYIVRYADGVGAFEVEDTKHA